MSEAVQLLSEVLYLVYKTVFQRISFSGVLCLLDNELENKIKIQFPIRKLGLRTHFFSMKTHQIFSNHTGPEKFENATITGNVGFVFEENSVRKIT